MAVLAKLLLTHRHTSLMEFCLWTGFVLL